MTVGSIQWDHKAHIACWNYQRQSERQNKESHGLGGREQVTHDNVETHLRRKGNQPVGRKPIAAVCIDRSDSGTDPAGMLLFFRQPFSIFLLFPFIKPKKALIMLRLDTFCVLVKNRKAGHNFVPFRTNPSIAFFIFRKSPCLPIKQFCILGRALEFNSQALRQSAENF